MDMTLPLHRPFLSTAQCYCIIVHTMTGCAMQLSHGEYYDGAGIRLPQSPPTRVLSPSAAAERATKPSVDDRLHARR